MRLISILAVIIALLYLPARNVIAQTDNESTNTLILHISGDVFRVDITEKEVRTRKIFEDVKDFLIVPKGYFLLQKKDDACYTGNITEPKQLRLVPRLECISFGQGQALSNSGDKLAAVTGKRIDVYDLKTGKVHTVVSKEGMVFMPAWSPDDSHIVFYYNEPGAYASVCSLMVVEVASTENEVRQIAPPLPSGISSIPGGRHLTPRWSPSGKRVMFEGVVEGANRYSECIAAVDLDGRNLSKSKWGKWSSDGKKLFGTVWEDTPEGGHSRLVIINIASGEMTKLKGVLKPHSFEKWEYSNDGSMVAIISSNKKLNIMDTQYGSTREVPGIRCNQFSSIYWLDNLIDQSSKKQSRGQEQEKPKEQPVPKERLPEQGETESEPPESTPDVEPSSERAVPQATPQPGTEMNAPPPEKKPKTEKAVLPDQPETVTEDTEWFLPSLAIAGVVVLAGVVLFLLLRRKHKTA